MHVVFWHAHRVGTVHTAWLALSDHSCQTDDVNLILRIENRPDRNYPRWWQRMEMLCISQSNSSLLCSILLLPVSLSLRSALFRYKWWSFERRVVSAYTVYLHILCMIEPGKGMRFSSSVKHLYDMHLSAQSPQIQIQRTNTLDGLSMVAQRKGA